MRMRSSSSAIEVLLKVARGNRPTSKNSGERTWSSRSTESVSMLAFDTLLRDLRFGRGAAIAVVIFTITAGLAVLYARLLGDDEERR